MGRIARVLFIAILSAAFIGIPLYCFSQGAGELINGAKTYIGSGDKEKAVSALDAAFKSANSAGDHEALMEIGDLYVSIDPSLKEKAMKAWLAAGRCKTR